MDIDYMSAWKDWTYDAVNFPEAEVTQAFDHRPCPLALTTGLDHRP